MISITRVIDVTTLVEQTIKDALISDGEHHKQWYLEELAQHLNIDLSEFDHEPGILP